MNTVYEGALYLLNLWVTFITEDATNIVLNALAMEFVMKLDDDFKQEYFRFNPGCVTRIYEDQLHKRKTSSTVTNLILCPKALFAMLVSTAFVLVPACSAFMVVYGPICTP